jgi:NADH-quinone oxidoreductase subunit H
MEWITALGDLEGLKSGATVYGQGGPWILGLIKVVTFILPYLLIVPILVWWERRLLSWMQDRIGPNMTGTYTFKDGRKFKILWGIPQAFVDGIKIFLKEDITPKAVDKFVYFTAPAVALFPAFALAGVVPWGPQEGIYGLLTPIADVEIGLLYILAVSSLGAYGVVLSGYASNNKYSLMGGLRASAQLISYELAMGVSLACIVLATGSLRITEMVQKQEGDLWGVSQLGVIQNWNIFTPFGFIAAIVFLIALVAETNRAPFDLPEAENELIAGYHTEYSSMKFGVFFMGEYAAMFLLSGVFMCTFVGGYNFLPIDWAQLSQTASLGPAQPVFGFIDQAQYWLAPLGFIAKAFGGVTLFVWLRATLPRLRYDQLMNLGWKQLLPAAVANFIVVGIWLVATRLYGSAGGWIAAIVSYALTYLFFLKFVFKSKTGKPTFETRTVTMVNSPAKKEAS